MTAGKCLTQPRQLEPELADLRPEGVGFGSEAGSRVGYGAYEGEKRRDGQQRRSGAGAVSRGGGGEGGDAEA